MIRSQDKSSSHSSRDLAEANHTSDSISGHSAPYQDGLLKVEAAVGDKPSRDVPKSSERGEGDLDQKADEQRTETPTSTDTSLLAPHHIEMLMEESGISKKVIEARAYRTVDKKADLKRRGFSDAQCNTPGLLIPIYGPHGQIVMYQYRPDEPRIKDGKPVKYEILPGSNMVLDVHPSARKMLGDPAVPLLITEGVKKGDALVSQGLCAVALLGVWNWRGRNEKGGRTVLAEWDYIALNNDRPVSIIYDSDVMRNPSVHKALVRLTAFLEGR